MALALSGTSNGSLNNLSLSGNTATIVDTGKAGTIVQVVQAVNSTTFTTTSSSFVDDGLTASITPTSSSNKILVTTNHSIYFGRTTGAFSACGFQLLRDSTTVYQPLISSGNISDYYIQATGSTAVYGLFRAIITYLDSPATTSSITYKTQCAQSYSATLTVNAAGSPNGSSYITLMEVVA
jgi:hypothetical protein